MEEMRWLWSVGLMAALLALSAFFSGSETALFSLDRLQLRKMEDRGPSARWVRRLLDQPSRLLITILIGNMLVNTAASSLLTSIAVGMLGESGVPIAIGVMTFLLLLFGEVTPKTLAIHNAERVALAVARPLTWFAQMVFPLRVALRKITDLHISLFGGHPEPAVTLTQDEFRTVIDVGHREGTLETAEREMLHSVLSFGDTTVADIMTPRVDISAAPSDMSQAEFLEFARATRHSKLPVFEGSIDHIVGIVDARELFLDPDQPFRDQMQPPLFVPSGKKVDDLLLEFEGQEEAIAVVVDEYGGTHGLVTVEDILEEIFGEIHDEYETLATPIERLASTRYRVHGGVPIQEVNRQVGLELPEEESTQTLAGFVMGVCGHIPEEDELIPYGNVLFYVEKMRGHRVLYVLLEKL